MEKQKRKYLILGHPRGGTTYMANLFRANGIKIGHEWMDEDGTSNWQMAASCRKYPFPMGTINPSRKDFEFEHVIQVMRRPIDCIRTTVFVEDRNDMSIQFRDHFINITGQNEFERAVSSYIGWHKLIKSLEPDRVVTLENAAKAFKFKDISEHERNKSGNLHSLDEWSLLSRISGEYRCMYESSVRWYKFVNENTR